MYSPDSKYILTGQSCPPDQQGSRIAYSPRLYLSVHHPNHSHGHVKRNPRVLWNTKINQLDTCTHKGEIHVLYCIWASIIEITSIRSHSSSARTEVQF